jgi:acylphosphatase
VVEASIRAIARGRVQGVGFRDFVERRARSLGLTGHVRNLADGRSVEVVAEGPRDVLEQLIECLHDGPGSAMVHGLEVDWGAATGRYEAFGVAH